MKADILRASQRGHFNYGWLDTWHSFSFGGYYDPNRMGFGLLRVLNDDTVEPGRGFDQHGHKNMEIVSIPLSGALEHRDSLGSWSVINTGDVQIMSAGSGVTHSEFNHSKLEAVKFLQIWILPKNKNAKPRYEQKSFPIDARKNKLQLIVSPDAEEGSLTIVQDAWFSMVNLSRGSEINYTIKKNGNAPYFFLIDGGLDIQGTILGARDAVGLKEADTVKIKAGRDSELLIIDVPQ